MTKLIDPTTLISELTYLKLARQIALNIHPLQTILETHQITVSQWETIQNNPHFQRLLQQQVEGWEAAENTHERVKLKAASMVEEFLPELYGKLHDPSETLNSKIEAAKLARDLAGMGRNSVDAAGVGEKFTVTINLGTQEPLRIEKDITPKVIEHE
jgi:hypothetical protein